MTICQAGFPAGGAEAFSATSEQANLQGNNYWSATEYAPNTGNAWNFNNGNGGWSG